MTCPEKERLILALDGRLSEPEARDLRRHAAGCARCCARTDEYGRWKTQFRRASRQPDVGGCSDPGTLSAFLTGGLPGAGREKVVEHLAVCFSCREEILEVSSLLKTSTARVLGPRPVPKRFASAGLPAHGRRPLRFAGAAAAAALFFGVVAILASRGEPKPRRPAEVVRGSPPPPTLPVPQESGTSAETPRPMTTPRPGISPPAPLPPERDPEPEPEKLPPPDPQPTKPRPDPALPPQPVKPTDTIAKAAPRGTVLVLAGTPAVRSGDEPWKSLKSLQGREFAGSLDFRTDGAGPVKIKMGPHTFFLQRQTEVSVSLEPDQLSGRLTRGEAFFDITPGKDAVAVETPHGRVDVKGTRFFVAVDRSDTEVAVQKGLVTFKAQERSVELAAGQRSEARDGQAPKAPERTDLGRRMNWVRALEEFRTFEAEQLTLQSGMVAIQDAAASGGVAVGVKGTVPDGQEPSAELVMKRRQPVPYALWVRAHWPHAGAQGLHVQVNNQARAGIQGSSGKPGWQWIRAGHYETSEETFRVRLSDSAGGIRIDQILLTSDLDFTPVIDQR